MIATGRRIALIRCLAVSALAMGVVGCTSGQTAYEAKSAQADALRQARQQLVDDLHACSTRYAYDPEAPNLPENALAPDELEWRECAYDAARNYTAVNTPLALDFATLIDEDQKMTTALANGEMSRTERRDRLRVLIQAVHDKELEQLRSLDSQEAREQELVRQVTNGLRGLH